MKKNFSVIFLFLAFICIINSFFKIKTTAFAIENKNNSISNSCKSMYLCDADNKNVIYSSKELEHYPIASMCKIMTLLLSFEEIDKGTFSLDDKIVVSSNASSMGGSQIFLESNAEYSVSELLKGITIASANDACVAMAEKICGSEEGFVNRMNERAKQLGMDNTVFVNCTGLPKPGQYSCAKDVATMFSNLIKHKEYFNFSTIWMDEIHHPKNRVTSISNTNKLVRFYNGCDGGKTGYTSEAGHCLCATALRNGTRLICVAINAPDSKTRFKEVSNLFNYGFANYVSKIIVDNNKPLNLEIEVRGGKKDIITAKPLNSIYAFTKMGENRSFDIDFKPYAFVKAPIKVGDKLGELVVYEKGVEIDKTDIISNENVEKASFFDSILKINANWQIL